MSPDEHVDAAAFVAYVEGRLPLLDQQTLEAHVERCSRCALALQHAAAREEALFELAAALEPKPRAKHAWSPTLSVGAMAAGVLFMLSGDLGGYVASDARLSLDQAIVQRTPSSAVRASSVDAAGESLASFPDELQDEAVETDVCIAGDEDLMCTLDDRL